RAFPRSRSRLAPRTTRLTESGQFGKQSSGGSCRRRRRRSPFASRRNGHFPCLPPGHDDFRGTLRLGAAWRDKIQGLLLAGGDRLGILAAGWISTGAAIGSRLGLLKHHGELGLVRADRLLGQLECGGGRRSGVLLLVRGSAGPSDGEWRR